MRPFKALTTGIVSPLLLWDIRHSSSKHQKRMAPGPAMALMHGTQVLPWTTIDVITMLCPRQGAYHISGSTELFPQHCQVPFLMWNEHLQEVSDELITILQEMPAGKQSGVLLDIKSKLALTNGTSKRTLTCSMHEWMLPPGDL
jgi:hypothetical protein